MTRKWHRTTGLPTSKLNLQINPSAPTSACGVDPIVFTYIHLLHLVQTHTQLTSCSYVKAYRAAEVLVAILIAEVTIFHQIGIDNCFYVGISLYYLLFCDIKWRTFSYTFTHFSQTFCQHYGCGNGQMGVPVYFKPTSVLSHK